MDLSSNDRAGHLAELAQLIAQLAAALAEDAAEPATPVEAPPVLLDITDAARLLGISRAKLYEGPIKRGELLTVLIDSRRLVPRTALDAYVASLGGRDAEYYNASGRGYPDVAGQGYSYAEVWDSRDVR
ncbi:helix-turn-helix domain-containing protein, partial [Jatrophihabitans endophyticus]|uniref:helix-turn-helix domain-containing protein n=1 Tax=Jatrophihabitans endophyticus TaxID=1206085 RepID=UPI0019ED4B8B